MDVLGEEMLKCGGWCQQKLKHQKRNRNPRNEIKKQCNLEKLERIINR